MLMGRTEPKEGEIPKRANISSEMHTQGTCRRVQLTSCAKGIIKTAYEIIKRKI